MKNDELATRRAEAIAGDRCFTKGRLRDEFRMKPAPGAEPVKWYKSAYGGKYAVYRIADCVRHCCKVSDEAAFCLIQRPYISKTLLTGRISPGDHHNKMLRLGLCVVHASPQYL
jgi:hypothetical protein